MVLNCLGDFAVIKLGSAYRLIKFAVLVCILACTLMYTETQVQLDCILTITSKEMLMEILKLYHTDLLCL